MTESLYSFSRKASPLMFDRVLDTLLNCTLLTFQPAITCSKLTIEALEQGVKYIQS